MQPRFVIVPAVPIEQESFRTGTRFYATTVSGGFDIYDNQEKVRLKPSYTGREDAMGALRSYERRARCKPGERSGLFGADLAQRHSAPRSRESANQGAGCLRSTSDLRQRKSHDPPQKGCV